MLRFTVLRQTRPGSAQSINIVDETIISTGECTTAPPGEYHMFESLEDSVVYEIYWVSLDDHDIVRENHGGK